MKFATATISRSGFTLAPEAATEKMRDIINKYVPDAQVLETAYEIYKRGWRTIKLYFMIGHPSETLEDVQAIAQGVLGHRLIIRPEAEVEGRQVADVVQELLEAISARWAILRRPCGRGSESRVGTRKAGPPQGNGTGRLIAPTADGDSHFS